MPSILELPGALLPNEDGYNLSPNKLSRATLPDLVDPLPDLIAPLPDLVARLPDLVAPLEKEDDDENEAADLQNGYFSDWNSSNDSDSDCDESDDEADLENLELGVTSFIDEVGAPRGSTMTKNILEHLLHATQQEAAFSLRRKQQKEKQLKEFNPFGVSRSGSQRH